MHYIKDFVFFMFGVSLFVNSMLFVPQIFKILKTKTSVGFSKTTFLGFCITQAIAIILEKAVNIVMRRPNMLKISIFFEIFLVKAYHRYGEPKMFQKS